MNRKDPRSDRDLVREALHRDHPDPEPDTSRLLEAVPAMMAEADRRRRLASSRGPLAGVVAIGRRAVPLLAAVTAILLAFASFLFYSGSGETSVRADERPFIDRLIIPGDTEGGEEDDILMQAIIDQENGNG